MTARSPAAREESTPPSAAAVSGKPASASSPLSATAAAPPSAAPTPCGDKGQPRCPLQAWMEDHLQAALDKSDAAALAKGLARAARFAPDPGWNAGEQGWSTLADAGAAAAEGGDLEAARKACKACHKAWRSKYKQTFRARPVSP